MKRNSNPNKIKLDGECDTLSSLLEAVKRPSANLTENANFSFPGRGGGPDTLKSEVQLDLKVPKLPTFHFEWGGGLGWGLALGNLKSLWTERI